MRMRKKKHGYERLLKCKELLLEKPESPIDSAPEESGMKNAPLWLEIGAGKGGFAKEMARRNPDVCYIAMEKITDCVMLAAESVLASGESGNLRFLIDTADNLTDIFLPNSLDALFLNFSDPWSKKGYAKRRLTHRRYLAVYFNLLKDGAKLRFKTDNVGLFDFTLEEIEAMGLTPSIVTRDLHSSEYDADNVRTEYEQNFSSQGYKINMLEVVKPDGFSPEIPDELKRGRKRYNNGQEANNG